MKTYDQMLATPAVFCVGEDYQILIPTYTECILWIEVDGNRYDDHMGGVLRSFTEMHRVTLPQSALDLAKSYTVCCREVIDRKPYFPVLGEVQNRTYDFAPLPKEGKIRIALVADTHGRVEAPIRAATCEGKPDLLVLDGDVPNYCDTKDDFYSIAALASGITDGTRPCVFARGNHDNRGRYAERLLEYIPHDNGRTYFTFRAGSVFGIVLDCGEDKWDDQEEYGGTIAFEPFRRAETAFLKSVLEAQRATWDRDDVRLRLVINHVPFSRLQKDTIFDIEKDTYALWTQLLREHFRPNLMLCGHLHTQEIWRDGEGDDPRPIPCTTVIGTRPTKSGWQGAIVTVDLAQMQAQVDFCDSESGLLRSEKIDVLGK